MSRYTIEHYWFHKHEKPCHSLTVVNHQWLVQNFLQGNTNPNETIFGNPTILIFLFDLPAKFAKLHRHANCTLFLKWYCFKKPTYVVHYNESHANVCRCVCTELIIDVTFNTFYELAIYHIRRYNLCVHIFSSISFVIKSNTEHKYS